MDLIVFSLTIIAGVFILVLLLPVFTTMSMDTIEQYSKILYNCGIGIGGVMGSIAGFKYIHEFLEKKKIDKKIKLIIDEYPQSEFRKNWDVVDVVNDPRIFIRETKKKIIHHVANPKTLEDLGFGSFNRTTLIKSDLNKYTFGEVYKTRS